MIMPPLADLLSPAFYRPVLVNLVRILFIFVFAYVANVLVNRAIRGVRKYAVRMMGTHDAGGIYEAQKRADTIGSVVRTSLIGMIWVMASIMVLQELNFDIRPLLAGAGIVGVAVGFGAQTLVKDVLGGFFLLLENQIRVNDVAVINGTSGLVEEINLRTTVLRGDDGAVHIIPNGSIQKLSNLTRDFSYYVFSIQVPYSEDADHVMEVLKEIATELTTEEAFRAIVLAPLDVWGVDALGDSGYVIKARFKTLPMKQWTVGREMNRRIRKRFSEIGIEPAFPVRAMHLTPGDSTQLRQEIRDVIQEMDRRKS